MKRSLQLQIVAVLVVLTGLLATMFAANQRLFNRVLDDQKPLVLAGEITRLSQDLERRGQHYAGVAPRNYRDYDRDVLVYYRGLQQDLEQIEVATAAMMALAISHAEHRAAIEGLVTEHRRFVEGLNERLGDNPDEPRLEWGAQYLAAEAPQLRQAAEDMQEEIVETAERRLRTTRQLALASWPLGAAIVLAVALWFWLRVARRIGLAAARCTAVAEGEFGTRLEDGSEDELGVFARSFNQLSARTRVVLGVLDRLPADAGREQAFQTLWNEARTYLGHTWQALIRTDATIEQGMVQLTCQSVDGEAIAVGKKFALSELVRSVELQRNGSALLPDLRRQTLDARHGQLLRELSRRDIRTLALVLLRDGRGLAHGVLALGWTGAHAEQAGIARFLSGLTRFLGRTLVREQASTRAEATVPA